MNATLETIRHEIHNLVSYDPNFANDFDCLVGEGWSIDFGEESNEEFVCLSAFRESDDAQVHIDIDTEFIEDYAENFIRSGGTPSLTEIARHALNVFYDEIISYD